MTYGLKEDTIASINEVFQRFPDVEQAILYGSRAMDRQRYNSDIDMTLIGPNLNMSILLSFLKGKKQRFIEEPGAPTKKPEIAFAHPQGIPINGLTQWFRFG